MQRVWASVLAVWALLALVAVLAWTRAPTPIAQQGARVVVVRTANGPRRVVVAPAAHTTTHTSGSVSRQQSAPAGQGATIVSGPQSGGGNG